MTREEAYDCAKASGHVRARWVGGAELPPFDVHNTMSYSAADVMAAAYGGDTTHIPKYVGFFYGPDDTAVLPAISRDMDWPSVRQMAKDAGGNVQVVRFNRKPSISVSEEVDSNDGAKYTGNVVEFHSVTRSGADGEYADDTSGESAFAGQFTSGMAVYRAILLGDGIPCDEENKYTVLAMVDLKRVGGAYRKKPESYELSLDWRVTFE